MGNGTVLKKFSQVITFFLTPTRYRSLKNISSCYIFIYSVICKLPANSQLHSISSFINVDMSALKSYFWQHSIYSLLLLVDKTNSTQSSRVNSFHTRLNNFLYLLSRSVYTDKTQLVYLTHTQHTFKLKNRHISSHKLESRVTRVKGDSGNIF